MMPQRPVLALWGEPDDVAAVLRSVGVGWDACRTRQELHTVSAGPSPRAPRGAREPATSWHAGAAGAATAAGDGLAEWYSGRAEVFDIAAAQEAPRLAVLEDAGQPVSPLREAGPPGARVQPRGDCALRELRPERSPGRSVLERAASGQAVPAAGRQQHTAQRGSRLGEQDAPTGSHLATPGGGARGDCHYGATATAAAAGGPTGTRRGRPRALSSPPSADRPAGGRSCWDQPRNLEVARGDSAAGRPTVAAFGVASGDPREARAATAGEHPRAGGAPGRAQAALGPATQQQQQQQQQLQWDLLEPHAAQEAPEGAADGEDEEAAAASEPPVERTPREVSGHGSAEAGGQAGPATTEAVSAASGPLRDCAQATAGGTPAPCATPPGCAPCRPQPLSEASTAASTCATPLVADLPRPPELPGMGSLAWSGRPAGRWADTNDSEGEETTDGLLDNSPAAAELKAIDYEQLHLRNQLFDVSSAWLRRGDWEVAKLAAMPLGMPCRGPRRKLVRRIEQRWLTLSYSQFAAISQSMIDVEQRRRSI